MNEAAILSRAQARFARRRHARVGGRSALYEGSVFLYHEGEDGTRRWLLDRSGYVVEETAFGVSTDDARIARGPAA